MWGPDITESGFKPDAVDPYSDFYLFFGEDSRTNDTLAASKRCNKAREAYLKHAAEYR